MSLKRLVPAVLLAIVWTPVLAAADPPARTHHKIEVRNDETLFTMFAYITIGTFEVFDPGKMPPIKRFVWTRLDRTLDPAVKRRVKDECRPLRGRMFEYNATMLALNCTPPPDIRFQRQELVESYQDETLAHDALAMFSGLESLPERLTRFYREARILDLYSDCAPWYDDAVAKLESVVSNGIAAALTYLKVPESDFLAGVEKVVIIPNLIGPRGSAMGPVWRRVKYDVQTPWDVIDYSAHEFVHDMVAPLTRSGKNRAALAAIAERAMNSAPQTPAVQYYPDPIDYFDESLVRAVDIAVAAREKGGASGNRDDATLSAMARRGFVLVPLIDKALAVYERAEGTFAEFFPALVDKLESAAGRLPRDGRP
jgi:hypothetical protein